MVDRLLGLRGAMQAETPDPATPRPRFAGAVMRDQEGRRWQVIDLEALARHEQFLRIVA